MGGVLTVTLLGWVAGWGVNLYAIMMGGVLRLTLLVWVWGANHYTTRIGWIANS